MTARFRPDGNWKSSAVKFRSDPPPGVRASEYYGGVLARIPKDVGAAITRNVWWLLREDLGSDEAVADWLIAVVNRRGAPLLVNFGQQTLAVGPGSFERLLGFIGVHHEWLEREFGQIERIGKPEMAA